MVQFANTDSNLIGYSGLSDIMANSIQLCSLLIYVYQVPKGKPAQSGSIGAMCYNQACCSQWVGTMAQFAVEDSNINVYSWVIEHNVIFC